MFHTNRKLSRTAVGLLVALVVALFSMPAFASAQVAIDCGAPTTDQYGNTIENLNCHRDGGLNSSVGGLPFTGFDVIAMLGVALGVTGLGLALQRAVARQSEELK